MIDLNKQRNKQTDEPYNPTNERMSEQSLKHLPQRYMITVTFENETIFFFFFVYKCKFNANIKLISTANSVSCVNIDDTYHLC